jgi:hypothetical protein
VSESATCAGDQIRRVAFSQDRAKDRSHEHQHEDHDTLGTAGQRLRADRTLNAWATNVAASVAATCGSVSDLTATGIAEGAAHDPGSLLAGTRVKPAATSMPWLAQAEDATHNATRRRVLAIRSIFIPILSAAKCAIQSPAMLTISMPVILPVVLKPNIIAAASPRGNNSFTR